MIIWKFDKFNADARKVYDELQSIGDTYTPEQIVDFARDENTELHKCFQWDDSIAAESWRKQQARQIVQSLVVVVETEEYKAQTYRLIEHDSINSAYKPVTLMIQELDQYTALLEQAKKDLRVFTAKYKSLTELSSVIEDLCNAPTVDAVPVRHAKWIYGEDCVAMCDGYRCSNCGFFVPWDYQHKFISYIEEYNYCPNCGARMVEE